jgi:hypothetical protein
MVHFVCDPSQDLAPTVRIRDLNRGFSGLPASEGSPGVLDSGLHVADAGDTDSEAPAARRDVDI